MKPYQKYIFNPSPFSIIDTMTAKGVFLFDAYFEISARAISAPAPASTACEVFLFRQGRYIFQRQAVMDDDAFIVAYMKEGLVAPQVTIIWFSSGFPTRLP